MAPAVRNAKNPNRHTTAVGEGKPTSRVCPAICSKDLPAPVRPFSTAAVRRAKIKRHQAVRQMTRTTVATLFNKAPPHLG